jgi:hypothetical protein
MAGTSRSGRRHEEADFRAFITDRDGFPLPDQCGR